MYGRLIRIPPTTLPLKLQPPSRARGPYPLVSMNRIERCLDLMQACPPEREDNIVTLINSSVFQLFSHLSYWLPTTTRDYYEVLWTGTTRILNVRAIHQITPDYTRFSLGVENGRADAGRNGTAEPVSRGQILRREQRQRNFIFPVQLRPRLGSLAAVPVDAQSSLL